MLLWFWLFFFFFQAEDGIRDRDVTGVQTCALPILLLLVGNQGMYQKFFSARSEKDAKYAVMGWIVGTVILESLLMMVAVIGSAKRSEERRVGKECRSRWSPCY